MPIDMKALARTGAEARIRELREQIAEMERAFPELRGGSPRRFEVKRGRPAPMGASEAAGRKRKRRAMSAAQRKAVGERMKKYWAERKKQAAKK